MLVSFTQTYGITREKLYDIYYKDNNLIEFKNKLDLNIYSFHNCPNYIIENFKKQNKVKNTKIFIFNNISYGETISRIILYLKTINCTYFFFSQDDTFSTGNIINFSDLLSYIKSNKEDFMLNLYMTANDLLLKDDSIIDKFDTFNVFYSNSKIFHNMNYFSLDDSPYICSFDVLTKIYDEEYFKFNSIWLAQEYLNEKYQLTLLNRFVLNISLFKNYNLIGRYINLRKHHINELTRLKLY